MGWLWGHTGKSFVDVWTIFHLSFWLFIGSSLWKKSGFNRIWSIVACMSVAYTWEFFEKYAEHKWPERWLTPESWYNSYISDPSTCIIGLLFAWYALDHWRKND